MFTRESLLAAAETIPQGGALPRRFFGAAVESRAIRPGQLFIDLARDRAARQRASVAAVDAGAAAILATTYDVYAASRGVPQLIVADPLAVLRHLARDCLRRQPRTQVVGVTGGADASAAKDAIAALLAHRAPTLRMLDAVAGEWPNETSALLALVSLDLEHRYAVLALDAQGSDGVSVASLIRLAAPRIGVVAPFDLAPEGSAAASRMRTRPVDQANHAMRGATALLRALPAEGNAVLDADGRHARYLAHQSAAPVVTYGRRIGADVRALRIAGNPACGARFTLVADGRQVRVQLGIPGERAVSVALVAAAVALRCGLALEAVASALNELRPPKPRGAMVRQAGNGAVVADGANPSAVAASYGQSELNPPA